MVKPEQTYVTNPQVQTEPYPAAPEFTPVVADPKTGETSILEPAAPLVPCEPQPAFDEESLRNRERIVQQREDALDQRDAKIHKAHVTPLTDKEVESQIVSEYAVCARDAFATLPNVTPTDDRTLRCITLVVLVLRNGFPIVGTSVCQAPENYDATEGRRLARADAIQKLWSLEEYAQRNRIMGLEYEPLDTPSTDIRTDDREPRVIEAA